MGSDIFLMGLGSLGLVGGLIYMLSRPGLMNRSRDHDTYDDDRDS